MGIFSRLHDIINSNINTLLDKAEDPEKIIRLMIQEMEDTLVEVRSDAARTIADKKKLQRKIEYLHRDIDDWAARAELALAKDREDLARAALKEKHHLQGMVESLEHELQVLEQELDELNRDTAQLQQKLDDAKARSKAMLLKQTTVSGRLRTREKLHDNRLDDALHRFERMEDKIDRMQGRVESYDLGQAGNSLKDKFSELESEDIIEQELSRLKSRMSNANE